MKKKAILFLLPYLVVSGYVILISVMLRLVCARYGGTINSFLTVFRISDIHFVTILTVSHAFSTYHLSRDRFCGLSPLYRLRDIKTVAIICILLPAWFTLLGWTALIPYGELDIFGWRVWGMEASVPARAVGNYIRISDYATRNLQPLLVFILYFIFLSLHLLLISLIFCREWHNMVILAVVSALTCYGDFQAYNELPSWATYLFPGSVLRCSFVSYERIIYSLVYYIVLISALLITARIKTYGKGLRMT